MIKAIISDFIRTLYLPELDEIPKEHIELLQRLKSQGYILCLVSMNELHGWINPSVKKLFRQVIVVSDRKDAAFSSIMQKEKLKAGEILVVGDRVRGEITAGNNLGMKTVWLKAGVFGGEEPLTDEEKPDFSIRRLDEIENVLKKFE